MINAIQKIGNNHFEGYTMSIAKNEDNLPIKSFVRVEKIKTISFDAYIDKVYLPYIKNKRKRWDIDLKNIQLHISPIFGKRILYQIKRHEINNWLLNIRDSGLAEITCNRILAIFRLICTHAEENGYIPYGRSPCRNISGFYANKRPRVALSERKLKHIKNYLEKSDKKEALIVRLIMATNASKGEALNAKWQNVFLDQSLMILQLPKSGKKREIYLNEEAKNILSRIPRNNENDWLFPGRNIDKPFTDIYIFWNKMRNELGMPNMRLDDLRQKYKIGNNK